MMAKPEADVGARHHGADSEAEWMIGRKASNAGGVSRALVNRVRKHMITSYTSSFDVCLRDAVQMTLCHQLKKKMQKKGGVAPPVK